MYLVTRILGFKCNRTDKLYYNHASNNLFIYLLFLTVFYDVFKFLLSYQGEDLSQEEQTEINNIMADKMHNNPLLIENVSLYGTYQCIARNEFGEDIKVIVLRQGFVPPPIRNVS